MLDGGGEISYRVVVTHQLSEIRSVLSSRFPGEQISLESSRGSLMVTGVVSSERVRATIMETLSNAIQGGSIIDQITVGGSNVIRLRVVLLEVSRNEAENFGIDWSATVSNNGFFIGADNRGVLRLGKSDDAESGLSAVVDLLVSTGIATIVQETVLTTVNGEQAQFSIGGEIPVPSVINQGTDAEVGNFQLDYKFIGTVLNFTPSIGDGNKLRLLIESEISSETGKVSSVNANTFPTLNSRSFRTTVELEDVRPFVVAGVSRNNSISEMRSNRGTGLSRTIDAVFGTDRITSSTQELVIIVTPLLGDDTRIPIRNRLPDPTSNLEFILSGTPLGKSLGAPDLGKVSAGFKY
jgi:pilus assembly protein CpaC